MFYGSGKDLIKRAYKKSKKDGDEYKRVVNYVHTILKIQKITDIKMLLRKIINVISRIMIYGGLLTIMAVLLKSIYTNFGSTALIVSLSVFSIFVGFFLSWVSLDIYDSNKRK